MAAEFTFFLAIPVMFGASALKVVKYLLEGMVFTGEQLAVLGLAAAMALSLAACGEKRPSQEDVEQSIEAGTLTIEDALDKAGSIRRGWMPIMRRTAFPPPAKQRATWWATLPRPPCPERRLPGNSWGMVVFFAFLDPEAEGTQVFYNALAEGYGGVAENGAEILVCTKAEPAARCLPMHPSPSSSTTTLWQQQLWAATEAWWRTGRCQTSPPGM